MGFRILSACAAVLLLATAGCAPLDRASGDRALTGTAVGAAGGLVYDQIRKIR